MLRARTPLRESEFMSPYRSSIRAALPDTASARVAGIALPSGLRVPSSAPCLWVSADRVRDVGPMACRLAAAFESTGLWPLVLEDLAHDTPRPWLTDELEPRATQPAPVPVAAALAAMWDFVIPDPEEGDDALELLAPFDRRFPGLAPAAAALPRPRALETALASAEGRLGLVAVSRPAEVVASIGWLGAANYFDDLAGLTAVLRSWEVRFGAVLVGVGFDTLTLAVAKPPTDLAMATAIAVEHFAVCSDVVGSIGAYATDLVDAGSWTFWWD